MKKTVKRLICVILACVFVLSFAACKKDGGTDTTANQNESGEAQTTIVGTWKLPESEWVSKSSPEYWVFTADGKFEYHQADSSGKISNTIDGTYTAEGENLSITMAGYTLPYTYKLENADTMIRSDHGTSVTLTRFKGTLTK